MELQDDAVSEIEWAIDSAEEVCVRSTTAQRTKVEGIKALLKMTTLINDAPEVDQSSDDGPNHQSELLARALRGVKATIETMTPDERAQFIASPEYQEIEKKFQDIALAIRELNDYYPGEEDAGAEYNADNYLAL